MPRGRNLQPDPPVVCAYEACMDPFTCGGVHFKLGRLRGWNLARIERSRLFSYEFVEKKEDREVNNPVVHIVNTFEFHPVACLV